MAREPSVSGKYRHSTVYFKSKANPRIRGSVTEMAAAPSTGIFADTSLPYGPEVPDADPVDGTIPAASLVKPLLVTAVKWAATEKEDYVRLFVDGIPAGDPDGWLIEDQPDPIEMEITVAELDLLDEREHALTFEMGSAFGDSYVSQKKTIRIDRTPPGGDKLPTIEFSNDYVQDGVTINQIVDAGNVLAGRIATYGDQQTGDTITTFIQAQPSGDVTSGPALTVLSSTDTHQVDFTLAQLIAAGADGIVNFWYEVKDKAGNAKTAEPSPLRMLITGAPDQLLAPLVALFSDDDLVSEQDARKPITVDIPEFGHAEAGDRIVLLLSNFLPIPVEPPLAAIDMPGDPENPDPDTIIRSIDVPYAVIALLNANPVFQFDCSYRVERDFFKFPSPSLIVDVDLTLPGGPDPVPETPEHEDYAPPVVAHSGAGAVNNEIPVGYAEPVFATIAHLTTGTTPLEMFEVGDVVQLFRLDEDGETPIAIGPETLATPGTNLVIDLDSADVVPGIWSFYYGVGRTLTTEQVNWGYSPTQIVTIDSATDQPGGPDLLPVAIFRNSELKQGFPAIGYTRSQTHGGTIVRIYGYANMALGDRVEISWQGNDMLRGNGDDIPAALYEPGYTVTATDLIPKDDRLEDDNPEQPTPQLKVFVDFLVPYAEMEKITPAGGTAKAYGSAWLTYTVTSAKGRSNSSETDRGNFKPLVIDARAPST